MNHKVRIGLLGAMGVALLAAVNVGCSPETKVEPGGSKAVFYPKPPDPPRLQFLMSFSSTDEWERKKSSFSDFVVGSAQDTGKAILNPYGVDAHRGKIYICDAGQRRVHVIDIDNGTSTRLGAAGQMRNPINVTIDSDGNKYVCDPGHRKIWVFDAGDSFVRSIGDPTTCVPIDVAFHDNQLYVADVAGGEVEIWSRDGEVISVISEKGQGPDQLYAPTNLDVGPDGSIFVTDTSMQIVKVFNQEGRLVRTVGAPGDRPGYFARPKGIAVDPHGNVYVADAQWEIVQAYNAEGKLLIYFGGVTAGAASMGMPAGIAIDDTSMATFNRWVSPTFTPEYLLFVANQFGEHKIGVYAFGSGPASEVAAPVEEDGRPPVEAE